MYQGYVDYLPEYLSSVDTVHPSMQSRWKRGLDIVGGALGLVLTAVLFIPVAIAIQLDNPGPILYSQIRCGYKGRQFRIWKFRSMVVGAERLQHQIQNEAKGHIFKNGNDPRITAVGQFLRRTSLDEFPQFWNVLMGDMSLVGTRPPTPTEVTHYAPRHWQRLDVKPGITGEWQVNGRSLVKDFDAIVDLDLRYQQNWSVWYDIHLLIKTVSVVLGSRGAC